MTEREWDRRLHIKTIGRGANYSPYEPTPCAVLQRLADSEHIRAGTICWTTAAARAV